ncbi:MAG: hypothetical protein GX138_01885 [Firmicutes bacterium]|jgi:hypothetical protein|nr:hypothetical protein [Bacillota bacterium]
MLLSKEPTWNQQLKQIQEIIEEKLERRSLIIKIIGGVASIFIVSSLLTSIVVQRQRMRQVVRTNRNGLLMDLQGLRHLIRQGCKEDWDQRDTKTLMAIRRSVLARISTLETADLRLTKFWSRLMNYLNYVMGAVGESECDTELMKDFEKILYRLETALESDNPSKRDLDSILKDLDELTAA